MDSIKFEESVTPPPNLNIVKPSMSISPKPRICLKRKDDTYVPLIAVDELPTWLRLEGVPLTLRGQEVLDLGMMNCGDQPKTNNDCYHIELTDIPSNIHMCIGKEGDESENGLIGKEPTHLVGKVFVAPDKKAMESVAKAAKVDDIRTNIAEVTSTPEDPPEPIKFRGTPGTLGKKVYCTYWIRTGNCNYMQEGCKYLHEIPSDEETRVAIGVRTFPTWTREDPTGPPHPVKFQGPAALLQQSWRRQIDNHIQAELPGTPKREYGPGRARSPIAAPIPRPGQNKSNGLLSGTYVPPIAASMQAPALYPQTNFFAPQQQSTLFSPPRRHFPSQGSSSGQQASRSIFDMNVNTHQSATPASEGPLSHQSHNDTMSPNNPPILGTSGRRQSPATQPPISRPITDTQPLNSSPANGSFNCGRYTPSQTTGSDYATSQANILKHADGKGYDRYAGFDNKRKATNSRSPNSRSSTPASPNANTTTIGNGNYASSFDGMQESTASPPILHRRLFVADGEPRYVANPVDDVQARHQPKTRKTTNGKGKANGHGKGGPSNKGSNHGTDSLI